MPADNVIIPDGVWSEFTDGLYEEGKQATKLIREYVNTERVWASTWEPRPVPKEYRRNNKSQVGRLVKRKNVKRHVRN